MAEQYKVDAITSLEQLRQFKSKWDEFAKKHISYRPFLCFNWFELWLNHFLDNHKLLILVVYKNGVLESIAPLMIKREKFKGIFVRKVQLIGNVYSPIQTFLFNQTDIDTRQQCLSVILDFFSHSFKQWDIINLEAIPEEEHTDRILERILAKDYFQNTIHSCFDNRYLDQIDYFSDAYFQKRSRNLRASIKKSYKKATGKGKLEFKMIKSVNEIDKYMKIYFDVYSRSWKKREKVGPSFYMELARETAKKGWLRLGIVFLNEVPVSAGFAFVCDGLAYFEKTAYNERYADIGAGTIWLTEMLTYVIDVDRVRSIDLLRGDHEYKKRWIPNRRERKGFLIYNSTIRGTYLAFIINKILPAINRNKVLYTLKRKVAGRLSRDT